MECLLIKNDDSENQAHVLIKSHRADFHMKVGKVYPGPYVRETRYGQAAQFIYEAFRDFPPLNSAEIVVVGVRNDHLRGSVDEAFQRLKLDISREYVDLNIEDHWKFWDGREDIMTLIHNLTNPQEFKQDIPEPVVDFDIFVGGKEEDYLAQLYICKASDRSISGGTQYRVYLESLSTECS